MRALRAADKTWHRPHVHVPSPLFALANNSCTPYLLCFMIVVTPDFIYLFDPNPSRMNHMASHFTLLVQPSSQSQRPSLPARVFAARKREPSTDGAAIAASGARQGPHGSPDEVSSPQLGDGDTVTIELAGRSVGPGGIGASPR